MKKPFVPDELDAHLRAILRMKEGKKNRNEEDIYKFGHYTLNAKHATLLDNERNKQITLTVREAQILQVLAENKGEVVRRDAILRALKKSFHRIIGLYDRHIPNKYFGYMPIFAYLYRYNTQRYAPDSTDNTIQQLQ